MHLRGKVENSSIPANSAGPSPLLAVVSFGAPKTGRIRALVFEHSHRSVRPPDLPGGEFRLQGYLAHTKHPRPRTLQYDYT